MITFQSNRQTLKSAQILESMARNTYPHISTSRIQSQIGSRTPAPEFFSKLKKDFSITRKMIRESEDLYTTLIESLKFGRIGNCMEDALLAELVGKINGQKNIYIGCLGINKNGKKGILNHVVAFITEKPVKQNKFQYYKNKDAIIIDPWLGITDFASNYFTKIKTIFRKIFMHETNKQFTALSNDNLVMALIRAESETITDFKEKKKEYCPYTYLSIVPFFNDRLNRQNIEVIKEKFPELTIKNYKKIFLT